MKIIIVMDFAELRTDLEHITGKRPLAAEDTLALTLGRLDAWLEKPELPKRLEHYLSQRSYVKALAWIDNPELPHQV